MTPAEQLQAWRGELVEERDSFAAELQAEQETLAGTESQYNAALAWRKALVKLVQNGVNKRLGDISGFDIAGALNSRLEYEGCEELKQASNALGKARARVKSLQECIAGREFAIAQIDDALRADKVTELRPSPEPTTRRKTQIVEFDNITPASARVV